MYLYIVPCVLCLFHAAAVLSWPWFRYSTALCHVPGSVQMLLFLPGLLSSPLLSGTTLSDFTDGKSSHTHVPPDEVIASICCVLVIFLVLYLLPVIAMHLFISLSPPVDYEFLEGKDEVLFISIFQHCINSTDSETGKNVCFTVKLKQGVNSYIIKADTAELPLLISIVFLFTTRLAITFKIFCSKGLFI